VLFVLAFFGIGIRADAEKEFEDLYGGGIGGGEVRID